MADEITNEEEIVAPKKSAAAVVDGYFSGNTASFWTGVFIGSAGFVLIAMAMMKL